MTEVHYSGSLTMYSNSLMELTRIKFFFEKGFGFFDSKESIVEVSEFGVKNKLDSLN